MKFGQPTIYSHFASLSHDAKHTHISGVTAGCSPLLVVAKEVLVLVKKLSDNEPPFIVPTSCFWLKRGPKMAWFLVPQWEVPIVLLTAAAKITYGLHWEKHPLDNKNPVSERGTIPPGTTCPQKNTKTDSVFTVPYCEKFILPMFSNYLSPSFTFFF